jgi:hypothetical protein
VISQDRKVAVMRKTGLGLAMLALLTPSALLAEPIGKVRGPFDKYRQFTYHFEFSVPRDATVVRDCVVGEIQRAAALEGRPPLTFKSKLSKRKGLSVEKLTWKIKTETGYTYEQEVTFTSGNGWTHVDTDDVYPDTYDPAVAVEPGKDGLVGLHTRCGLAKDAAFPDGMPRPLARTEKASDIKLSATATQSLYRMMQCVGARSEDLGAARISSTFEADHLGAFYAYYILNYNNLGSTVREYYAVKFAPTDTGTRLELVAPDIALGSDNPAELRKENYAARQIEKCGGVFDEGPANGNPSA